jgi:serralysin
MANVFGTDNPETINALDGVTNGADTIFGFGGDDTIFGLGGNDLILGGNGADAINGGSGTDTASYSDSVVGVTVSLLVNEGFGGTAEGDTLTSIENLTGSAHADLLVGNDGANVLTGLENNDTLKGFGGNDTLFGDSGSDTLKGGGGADTLNGGSGIDTATYADSSAGVAIVLYADLAGGGDAEGDELNSIENVTGSDFDDVLWGNDGVNVLRGNEGDDSLKGMGGSDTLHGGDDNDFIDGGTGTDIMTGGLGNDVFRVDALGDVVTESVGQGNDRVETSATYVLAAGSEIETLETVEPTDTTNFDLVGNEFNNTIRGNDGQNTIVGGLGRDHMFGNGGGDVFVWQSTADTATTAASADVVGSDFNAPSGDLLAFNPIDANETIGGNQAFTFIGAAAFTAAGQLRAFTDGIDTFVQLNTDGDLSQEATIRILGVHAVDASWFVL